MPASITIHGIKNCDTMKKARAWLESHGIAHDFHDYKAKGIDGETLQAWAGKVGWQKLLNRSGTTFRKLPDAQKEGLTETSALALMQAQPSMIKRPVLALGDRLIVGFDAADYAAALGEIPRD